MFDLLEKYLNLKADFIEIRASKSVGNSVQLKSGEVKDLVSGEDSAASVRIMQKGAWGFASTNDLSRLEWTAKSALKMARVSQKLNQKAGISKEKAYVDRVVIKPKKDPEDYSLEQKVNDLLKINNRMKMKKIASCSLSYSDSISSKYYLNSEGARIEIIFPLSNIFANSTAKGNSLQSAYKSSGGLFGYEVIDEFGEKAEEASKIAVELLTADLIKSDKYDVVIGSEITGLLAHEAIGHACEADHILERSTVLEGRMGQKIGSDLVNIVDDGTIPRLHGTFSYDDEGVKSQRKYLIKKGVVNSFLHSRETAYKLNTKSTGNCRGGTVEVPIVRMSNTFFERGDANFDDLLDIKYGVYIEGFKGGQVNTTQGDFQFGAERGWLIENGELTKPLRDLSIAGSILDTLKRVDAIGKEKPSFHLGYCGKMGQRMRVSTGGSKIRVRGIRVGGS